MTPDLFTCAPRRRVPRFRTERQKLEWAYKTAPKGQRAVALRRLQDLTTRELMAEVAKKGPA